jgi:hypothetical protein
MDQIIIGVDTLKSNHIAVALNANGARLGALTIPTTRQGYSKLEAWAAGFDRSKRSVLKARDRTARACHATFYPKATSSWM